MNRSRWVLLGGISALFAATLVTGCGDDSDDDDATGGSTSTGGKSTTGGKSGTGGTAAGGTGAGGTAGAGGAVDPEAGAGGSDRGGAGGGPAIGGELTKASDTLIESVNDLRGLTFAKSGKIYGSGHVGADASVDRELAVVRLNADGTPDDSFGDEGVVTFNLRARIVEDVPTGGGGASGEGGAGGAGPTETVVNDGDEQSIGIVELDNGDLIVQANVRDEAGKGTDVVLLRLDSDGELVTSFGDAGMKKLDFGWTDGDKASWALETGPSDQAWGLSLDSSGDQEKVVVFGFGPAKVGQMTTGNAPVQRTDNDRYVARLLADDGSLDPDFNDGEVFSFNSGGVFSDGARRGLVEADGSIVSSGYTNYGEGLGNHIVLIRLRPDGTPDANFGFGIAAPGVVRSNPFLDDGGVAECYALGKQSSGRYVTVGYGRATVANGSSSYDWQTTEEVDLVSFGVLPGGIDTTFGREGTLAIQSEGLNLANTEDRGRDLVVLPDDRVVLAGRFGTDPALFVLDPDGEFDPNSGDDGRFRYDPLTGTTSHFFRVTASADGKRIAASTNNHADGVLVALLEVAD